MIWITYPLQRAARSLPRCGPQQPERRPDPAAESAATARPRIAKANGSLLDFRAAGADREHRPRRSEAHLAEPLREDASHRAPALARVRPFRWDDLDSLFRLDCAGRGRSPENVPTAFEAFRAGLRLPGADPERNVLLAECEEQPCGYVRLDLELSIGRAVAWLRIAAGARAKETAHALVEAAAARARQAGAPALHVPIDHPRDSEHAGVLRALGMRVVHRHLRMRRPALPVDVPRVPKGLRVRPFEPGRDEPALTELQNAVFTGSWGYSPNTVEDVAERLALPGRGPGGVLFVEDGTGPVAYCWTGQESGERGAPGLIQMMGVRPGSRGRGLGRLVASLGIQLASAGRPRQVELEADSANQRAVRLYRRLGFERVSDVVWYELRLTG